VFNGVDRIVFRKGFMKPRLSKPQRKALNFAHDLMSGYADAGFLPYVRGTTYRAPDGITWRNHRHWIEPDKDVSRPFLNEDIFSILEMDGYMEMRAVQPDSIWIYRISRDGCEAIGRDYPLYPQHVMDRIRARLRARREQHFEQHRSLLRQRGGLYNRGGGRNAHRSDGYLMPFNHKARKK